MKTQAIRSAAWVQHAVGTLAQVQQVFIEGNALPARWAGRERYTILDTGFGLGTKFLATLHTWRADAARCRRLIYVAIESDPPSREALALVPREAALHADGQALVAAWPARVPSLHPLAFAGGRVQLLLAFGDIRRWLPQLRAQVDAFYVEGAEPVINPTLWHEGVAKGLARLAGPGATLAASSADAALRAHLVTAGFVLRDAAATPSPITLGDHAPRFRARRVLPVAPNKAPAQALVIGAGLAGAWTAHALAQRGVAVTVIDQHAAPAAEASGNPAGIYHPTVHPDDGPHAQLLRAAALLAQRQMRPLIEAGLVRGQARGLLRLEDSARGLQGMQHLVSAQGLPATFARALSRDEASALAGVALAHPGWWFADAGWVAPATLVQHLLRTPGVSFLGNTQAARLLAVGDRWSVLDSQGNTLAQSAVVVMANGAGVLGLLDSIGAARWPLQSHRGQVSLCRSQGRGDGALLLPVAGAGYALPYADGVLLCGASAHADDADATLRESDHAFNLERLRGLTGLRGQGGAASPSGRVGWRVQVSDRLPIVGALPVLNLSDASRQDHARFVPRVAGLYVATALGGRGITLAPLLGELLAAQICGEALPLGADLVDAIDPARWQVHKARQAQR